MAFVNNRREAIKKLRALVFTPKSNVFSFREKIEQIFYRLKLPNNVEKSDHNYGGIVCDVLSPEIYSTKRVMLYIHGGSFVGGSRVSWRPLCAKLAHNCFCRVVVPEISLAPENQFAQTVEDVMNVFNALYTEEIVARLLDATEKDREPKPEIILAADSSGAAAAISFMLKIEQKNRKRISKILLLSPWLNFSPKCNAMTAKKNEDEILSADILKKSSELALGKVYADYESLMISPALYPCDDFINFPPIYIQMGENEILLPDIREFAGKIEGAGGKCIIEAVPKMMFMFQMADDFLPEAHDAVIRIGKMIAMSDEKHEDDVTDAKSLIEKSFYTEE